MLARREVLAPRYAAAVSGSHSFSDEPFLVELKDMFSVPQLPHIFTHVQSREQMVLLLPLSPLVLPARLTVTEKLVASTTNTTTDTATTTWLHARASSRAV